MFPFQVAYDCYYYDIGSPSKPKIVCLANSCLLTDNEQLLIVTTINYATASGFPVTKPCVLARRTGLREPIYDCDCVIE